ncbi:MAG: regulatory protein GntR [Gemmatimonadetes bacterium]|nr:regulatory protein GntR [Gemmatimonadota bacterium]
MHAENMLGSRTMLPPIPIRRRKSRRDVTRKQRFGRVLRGIESGTLRPGDRMPTSREVAPEFDADYRIVILAYKELQKEGLVELRPRGGVYVSSRKGETGGSSPLPELWLTEMLTAGLAREIPGPELSGWLQRCVETLRLRVLIVASTEDQIQGLCRELRDDFGLEPEGVLADELKAEGHAPGMAWRADLLITTAAHADWVTSLAGQLHKPTIVITVRPELLGGEWALLLRRPVYAVVATPAFGDMLRGFFSKVPGVENLRIVVFGRDDLSMIPEGTPTYVTQRVRAVMGQTRIPGNILPAARTISAESAREIFAFIVRSNIEAMGRLGR